MTIDVSQPSSPGWWFKKLADRQRERRQRLDDLWNRLQGNPPLPPGAENAKEAFQRFQRKARTNYAELIVGATADRMLPVGFRTGADEDENGDRRARDIWVANELPVESSDLHDFMLGLGEGHAIVGSPDEETGLPVITVEDPRDVITAQDPARPLRVNAGLKLYHDDEASQDVAKVYLTGGRVFTARRDKPGTSVLGPYFRLSPRAWSWSDDETVTLPTERCLVVPFPNKGWKGEFERHIDHLDRINYILLQRMVIAAFQAFKQRAVKGVPSKDPKTGEPVDYNDVFSMDPGAMWLLPATAELWESGQVDLSPLLNAVRDDVRDLAAVTRTPLSYLTPDAANESAEGASTQREGAVFKAEDRIARATSRYNLMMSIAFELMGDAQRADLNSIETLWRPAERFSLAEKSDAVTKLRGTVPWRSLMTDIMQFTPDQVGRMEVERMMEQFTAPAPVETPVSETKGTELVEEEA